jgi:hypothetical protein
MKLKHFKKSIAILIIALIGLNNGINAQSKGDFSSYGGMFALSSNIKGSFNPLLGGFGGVVYKQKLGFGAFGNGKLGKTEFQQMNSEGATSKELNIKLGYGGLFVEYFVMNSKRIRLHTPVKFGYGGVGIYNVETGKKQEKSRLLVLEPQLHIDIRLLGQLSLNLQGGYRLSNISDLQNISSAELSGWSFGLGLIFTSNFSNK